MNQLNINTISFIFLNTVIFLLNTISKTNLMRNLRLFFFTKSTIRGNIFDNKQPRNTSFCTFNLFLCLLFIYKIVENPDSHYKVLDGLLFQD